MRDQGTLSRKKEGQARTTIAPAAPVDVSGLQSRYACGGRMSALGSQVPVVPRARKQAQQQEGVSSGVWVPDLTQRQARLVTTERRPARSPFRLPPCRGPPPCPEGEPSRPPLGRGEPGGMSRRAWHRHTGPSPLGNGQERQE
jgi:hypothetical protein